MDKSQTLNNFKKLLEHEIYIFEPFVFLEDKFPEAYDGELDFECLSLIIEHNYAIIEEMKHKLDKLINEIDSAQNINDIKIEESNENEEVFEEDEPVEENNNFNNYDEYVEVLLYAQENNTLEQEIKELALKQVPINSLKFAVYKRIKQLELQIRFNINHNPLNDVSKLQEDIHKLSSLIHSLTPKETEVLDTSSKEKNKYNIIFIPNSKNQLYIYDDINNYLEQSKEIIIALDKIYSGFVMESKNIKSIKAKNEKLYEYRTTNGLRIMFVISGNNIFVSLLFYKDKQRSIEIDSLYDEAIKRFQINEEALLSSLNNPDFMINQAELLGNLYTLLENRSSYILRKGGE